MGLLIALVLLTVVTTYSLVGMVAVWGADLLDDGGQPIAPLTGYPTPTGDVVVDPLGLAD